MPKRQEPTPPLNSDCLKNKQGVQACTQVCKPAQKCASLHLSTNYPHFGRGTPAYLICGTGISWASLVVHHLPGQFRKERWFISEYTTGGAIDIPETTSREYAVECAVDKIKALGQD